MRLGRGPPLGVFPMHDHRMKRRSWRNSASLLALLAVWSGVCHADELAADAGESRNFSVPGPEAHATEAHDAEIAVSAEEADVILLDRLSVTSNADQARETGGSVTFVDHAEIEKFSYSDVGRILRQVPGVNIQEEDGFGLRPNIGIRGSGSDRSSKIAVMEDGILVAPAPYAAPAAYYTPSFGRIHQVEVSKGPAAIKYGPNTVGGAVNYFSTPIPDDGPGGTADLFMGDHGARRAHLTGGGWVRTGGAVDAGVMLETWQDRSTGFKELDSGGDTGYRISDYVGKLALRTNAAAAFRQTLELKIQYSDEVSDETYLGLSLADFAANPYRRYSASQRDEMNVEHQTYQATHLIDLGGGLDLTTTAYHTRTKRAWYKLNDVCVLSTCNIAANGNYSSLANVLDDPAGNAAAYAILTGGASADNALRVRNNNREYQAWGIQSVLGAGFMLGETIHQLELSARYHEDEEDRFQNDDGYRMINGTMVRTSTGSPGSQDNRIGEANAWAFFLRDTIDWGPLTLVPGVRHEIINLKQTRYAGSDPGRTAPASVQNSRVDVWIPGMGFTYSLTESWHLVGGVHRGFVSPAPGSSADAETSVNYEGGVRYGRGSARFEAIAFFNDYTNLVGTCTASTGGGCNPGDQFDGGEVDVKGLEVTIGGDAGGLLGLGFSVPLSAVYTYTATEFGTSFTSGYGPWGTVTRGDELPYVPEHQLTLNAGLAGEAWRANLTMNYAAEARSVAGQGSIPANRRIDARTILDLSAEYDVTANASLFASVENLTDKVYNVAFSPAGARPGLPRTLLGGVKLRF